MGATPLHWKCGKCKRRTINTTGPNGPDFYHASGRPVPTGRVWHPEAYRPVIEYRCEECGHVGRTRHPHAVSRARGAGFCPAYSPRSGKAKTS